MAGYREFQTGEVLTAANVNSFLMEQATMTFADAAARDAALAGVLREGLLTYNLDEGRLEVYDGNDWVEPAPPAPPQNLVAVKSVLKTDTFSASVGSQNRVDVTGLSLTHEVADEDNRLIITAFFGVAGTSGAFGQVGIGVAEGSTPLALGDAGGGLARVTAGGKTSPANDPDIGSPLSITIVHTPGLGSKAYNVQAINIRNQTNTVNVNRSHTESATFTARAASGLIIQEVMPA